MRTKKRHRFTQEQAEFIINNYKNLEQKALLSQFNLHFKTALNLKQIKNKIRQLKISKRNIQENYGKYTEEMVEWLKENHNKTTLEELTKNFNAKFNTAFTKSALWHKKYRVLGAQIDRTRKYIPRTAWTEEMEDFLKENYDFYKYKKLSNLINKKFKVKTTVSSIEHKVHRLGLKKSPNGIRASFNVREHSKFWFQPGQTPALKKPIGYERVNKTGYTWVKVREPDTFKAKHRFIWEKHHGKIPANHCLIFLDGNKQNITLDNLALVSRGELAVLNIKKLRKNDKQLSKSGILLAKLIIKTNKKDKEAK